MGNKYVSLSGNNGNAGTGPLYNQAWATLEYAVDTMSDGDVLYVAPGIWRDVITIGVSPTTETKIVGDPLNTCGFKDSNGVLIPQGPVIVTDLLTDDVSSATNTTTIDCNGKDYLTFENLWIENNAAAAAVTVSAASQNVTLRNCYIFAAGGYAVTATGTAGVSSYLTIERCVISSAQTYAVNITLPKHTAAYDAKIYIRDSAIFACGSTCIYVGTSATADFWGEWIEVQNCTLLGYSCFHTHTNYGASITNKFQVKNCLMFGYYGVRQQGGAAGDVIVEDYNYMNCTTPRTNVGTGSNTIIYGSNSFSNSLRFDMGQSQLLGFHPKSFMAPWSTSRIHTKGNDSTPTALTVDMFNRVRPSGPGITSSGVLAGVGAIELHDYGTKDTATKDAGDASLKMVGPGDHEFKIAVDAAATTISIKGRMDSGTYGGTNYPQAILVDSEGFAGITGNTETKTMASTQDTWETLTFTAFTPTRKGVIRLRLVNRGAGADDVCWFDTLGIA